MRDHPLVGRQASAILSLAALLAQPLAPAVITVEGDCTLVDAITAANEDGAAGGCIAGDGPDTVVLTGDVLLTEVDNEFSFPNGLPVISTDITIQGGGSKSDALRRAHRNSGFCT